MDGSDLIDLALSYQRSRVLQTAVVLGVFEGLASDAASSAELADVLDTNDDALERILEALVSLGLVSVRAERFFLTETARRYLLRSSDEDLSSFIRWAEQGYRAWASLELAAKTGRGLDVREHLGGPTWGETWARALHARAVVGGLATQFAASIDVGERNRLLDVGGGLGAYSAALCARHPSMHATVIDRPGIVALAEEVLPALDGGERVTPQAGDIIEGLPVGYDIALLVNLLHLLDAAPARSLLTRVHNSLLPDGIVIVAGPHRGSIAGGDSGAMLSLTMLLCGTTANHHIQEIESWLTEAGFVDVAETSTVPDGGLSVVAARRAD